MVLFVVVVVGRVVLGPKNARIGTQMRVTSVVFAGKERNDTMQFPARASKLQGPAQQERNSHHEGRFQNTSIGVCRVYRLGSLQRFCSCLCTTGGSLGRGLVPQGSDVKDAVVVIHSTQCRNCVIVLFIFVVLATVAVAVLVVVDKIVRRDFCPTNGSMDGLPRSVDIE